MMRARWLAPAFGALLIFVSAVSILIAVLPGPLRSIDYFLVGAGGTLLALCAFFLTQLRITKARDIFYRKRRHE